MDGVTEKIRVFLKETQLKIIINQRVFIRIGVGKEPEKLNTQWRKKKNEKTIRRKHNLSMYRGGKGT